MFVLYTDSAKKKST